MAIPSDEQRVNEARDVLDAARSQIMTEWLFVAAVVLLSTSRSANPWEINRSDRTTTAEWLAAYLLKPGARGRYRPGIKVVRRVIEAANTLKRAALDQRLSSLEPGVSGLDFILFRLYTETFFERGTAYHEQIVEEIQELLAPFDDWLEGSPLGCSASGLLELVLATHASVKARVGTWIAELASEKLNWHKARQRLIDAALEISTTAREQCILANGSLPSTACWNSLISLIGFNENVAASPAALILARQRPLFVLKDDRVLMADLTHTLDALWNALALRIGADQGIRDQFQRRRAQWLEDRTCSYLSRIFGPQCVYRSVSYPDPDKPDRKATAELDCAVYWGGALLLVEAKAKQFRLEGQLGDVSRLRHDLKANVEDAFAQGLRARRYLDSVETVDFRETASGRALSVRRNLIRRVYLVTVSFHFLGRLVNGLANLSALGLFRSQEYPWAVNRANLEIISQFCETPDVFLHYLDRRQELDKFPVASLNHEIDLFAAYLSNRLHPEVFKSVTDPKHQAIFPNYDLKFDEWMEFRRGDRKSFSPIGLRVPESIRSTLRALASWSERPEARRAAFTLLQLSSGTLVEVARLFEEMRSPKSPAERAIAVGDTVVAITRYSGNDNELQERTKAYVEATMLRLQAGKGVGLNVCGSKTELINCCVWCEHLLSTLRHG